MNRTQVSRTCHEDVRAAGPETSVAMRRIIILSFIKLIRAPGIRGPVCPRVPRSIWILEPPVFVGIFCVAENLFLGTISSSHLRATSKTLLGFGVLGRCLREGGVKADYSLVRVVSAVYDCAPSLSPALRSLHGRPGCSGSNRSTDLLPLSPLSLYPRR